MHKVFSSLKGFKFFNITGEVNDKQYDDGDGALFDAWLDGDSYGDGQYGNLGDGQFYHYKEDFDFSFNLKYEEE
jgi:hypothetical protein